MNNENKIINALFIKLLKSKLATFPQPRRKLSAPKNKGVYLIYSPHKKIVHVGRTPRGEEGLRQRLCNHLHGSSSFTKKYLKGKGSKLRHGYRFRYLVVKGRRQRALLEAYATGYLCPKHLGHGDPQK